MNKNIYEVKKTKLRTIFDCSCSALLSILFIGAGIYSIYIETGNIVFGIILIIIGILFLGYIIPTLRKKVKVWKNQKIEYCNGFTTKSYKFCDVARPKIVNTDNYAIVTGDNYDLDLGSEQSVYHFYTKDGKKIFKLSIAYKNLDKLVKDLSK